MSVIKIGAKPVAPEGVGFIRSYQKLTHTARQFAAGKYGLVVVVGGPGLAKSTIIRNEIEAIHQKDYGLIKANAKPYGAYCKAYEKRNKFIQIDDADILRTSADGLLLLRQMTDTDQRKLVSWESKITQGRGANAPPSFSTTSKIIIITNKWNYTSEDEWMASLVDRGHCHIFAPSLMEVHQYVSTWFWDQEILDEFAKVLKWLRTPSCRSYYKAWEKKEAGDDWKEYVLSLMFNEEDLEYKITTLLKDDKFASDAERIKEAIKQGICSRATWFRYVADLRERLTMKEVREFECVGLPPQEPEPEEEEEEDEEVVGCDWDEK